MIDLVYANGDSWTYGSELEDRVLSWPWLVARDLGRELYNAAVPGGTNDKIVRTTVEDCLKFVRLGQQPLVLIAWTQLHRFELPIASSGGENYYNFVNPNDTDTPAIGTEIWQSWSTDQTDVARWCQQQLLLAAFLTELGIPYHFFITFNRITVLHSQWPQHTVAYHNQAFDLITQAQPVGKHKHPLEQGHKTIADYVLAKIGSVEEQ